MDAFNSLQYMAAPLASTTLKASGAVVCASGAKLNQVFSSLLDEKIFQQVANIGSQATKLYKEIKGTCNSPEYNMANNSEEKIIQFLMCKIINNEDSDKQSLSQQSLYSLAAILNQFSNDSFIAMPKIVYETEKQSATAAVAQAAAGTAITSAVVDAGVAATKKTTDPVLKSTKDILNTPAPGNTSGDAFVSQMAAAPIGLGVAYGLVYAGAEILKDFNTKIPKQFIPDFNKLITGMAERQKEIQKRKEEKEDCFQKTMKQFAEHIKKTFVDKEEKGINQKILQNFPLSSTNETVQIFKTDFNYEKGTIRPGASSRIKVEAEITAKCKIFDDRKDFEIHNLEVEITKIQEVINIYISLFKIRDDRQVRIITKEIVPLIQNINIENITMAQVDDIKSRLTGVKVRMEAEEREREQREGPILQLPGSISTKLDSVSSGLSSMGKSASSGLSSFSKRLGYGGKTRKYHKNTRRRRKKSPKKHR
jgi:hypothetical protein